MSGNTITSNTTIGELLSIKPEAAQCLMNMGMHCIGCPSSQMETLEEACMVHGMEVDTLLEQINAL